HATGMRKAFARPETEWRRQRDESWRIVSDELWQRAQAISKRRGAIYARKGGQFAGTRAGAGHRGGGEDLLSGLGACGHCGGVFYGVKRPDRWRCHWRLERGVHVCASELIVAREALEQRVLGAVTERILTPENLLYVIDKATTRVTEQLAYLPNADD